MALEDLEIKRNAAVTAAQQRLTGIVTQRYDSYWHSRDGPPKPYTEFGNTYECFGAHGIKKDGEPFTTVSSSLEELVNTFAKTYGDLLTEKKKLGFTNIVWRSRPVISLDHVVDNFGSTIHYYKIYSRLAFE